MTSFDQIVTNVVSDITGLQTDVITVAVAIIGIVVILVGLDFFKDAILGSGYEKQDNITFESCDRALLKFRAKERFMNKKYGRGHTRNWDPEDDKYI